MAATAFPLIGMMGRAQDEFSDTKNPTKNLDDGGHWSSETGGYTQGGTAALHDTNSGTNYLHYYGYGFSIGSSYGICEIEAKIKWKTGPNPFDTLDRLEVSIYTSEGREKLQTFMCSSGGTYQTDTCTATLNPCINASTVNSDNLKVKLRRTSMGYIREPIYVDDVDVKLTWYSAPELSIQPDYKFWKFGPGSPATEITVTSEPSAEVKLFIPSSSSTPIATGTTSLTYDLAEPTGTIIGSVLSQTKSMRATAKMNGIAKEVYLTLKTGLWHSNFTSTDPLTQETYKSFVENEEPGQSTTHTLIRSKARSEVLGSDISNITDILWTFADYVAELQDNHAGGGGNTKTAVESYNALDNDPNSYLDCRDMAVYFSGLLRSIGIPTRYLTSSETTSQAICHICIEAWDGTGDAWRILSINHGTTQGRVGDLATWMNSTSGHDNEYARTFDALRDGSDWSIYRLQVIWDLNSIACIYIGSTSRAILVRQMVTQTTAQNTATTGIQPA